MQMNQFPILFGAVFIAVLVYAYVLCCGKRDIDSLQPGGLAQRMKCPQCNACLSIRDRAFVFSFEGGKCPHCSIPLRTTYWWVPAALMLLSLMAMQTKYGMLVFATAATLSVTTWIVAPIRAERN
jgi:hypothetical protein